MSFQLQIKIIGFYALCQTSDNPIIRNKISTSAFQVKFSRNSVYKDSKNNKLLSYRDIQRFEFCFYEGNKKKQYASIVPRFRDEEQVKAVIQNGMATKDYSKMSCEEKKKDLLQIFKISYGGKTDQKALYKWVEKAFKIDLSGC